MSVSLLRTLLMYCFLSSYVVNVSPLLSHPELSVLTCYTPYIVFLNCEYYVTRYFVFQGMSVGMLHKLLCLPKFYDLIIRITASLNHIQSSQSFIISYELFVISCI